MTEVPATTLRYRAKPSAARVVASRAEPSGAAYSAMLEIADRCNEACIHCYQVQGQKGELSTEQWERVLDELAQMGVLFVTFSGGEPSLRKDFLHLVTYARRLRFAVKIYSNALNITDAMARELGRLAVQEVQISLYSHEAEVHDSVTRVPGSFARVVAATRNLRAAGVRVLLKTPLLNVAGLVVREYAALASSLGADYAIDPRLSPREDGDSAPQRLSVEREVHLALLSAPEVRSRLEQGPRRKREQVCGACTGNVHVEPNGELRPCTQWAIGTGNVTTGNIAQTFRDDPVARGVRELTWSALPGCRGCDLRPYCKRCFATAHREVGNALLPYPSACRSARWGYESRHGVAPTVLGAETEHASPPKAVGPYRMQSEHVFRVEVISLTPEDEARLIEHPWLHATPAGSVATNVGPLVQLKRRASSGLTSPEMKPSTDR